MSRHFTRAATDYVEFGAGSAASNRATGTWACIWKADALAPNGLILARDGSGNGLWGGNPYSDGNLYWSTSGFLAAATYSAATWYCTVIRKAAGGNNPVTVDTWDYTAGSWTTAVPGSLPDHPFGPNATFRLGWNGGGDALGGNLAAQALWAPVLSDADVLTLPAGMAGWLDLAPGWAVQFNQPATSDTVLDLTGGGGDQAAISGTSVSADEPAGWTYYTPTTTVSGVLTANLHGLNAAAAGLRTIHGAVTAQVGTLATLAAGSRTVHAIAHAALGAVTAHAAGPTGSRDIALAIGQPRRTWAVGQPARRWAAHDPRR